MKSVPRRRAVCFHTSLTACLVLALCLAVPALLPPAMAAQAAHKAGLAAGAKRLHIIAGTSLIEDIVLDLGRDFVSTRTVIKGSSCPGHESARTTDYVFAARADLVLVHAFQQNMPQITGMLDSVENKNLRLTVLGPKGSWLLPETQKQATLDIAALLAQHAPAHAALVQERAEARLQKVDAAGKICLQQLAALAGSPVAVADMQVEFVRWAGFRVVKTYGRAEDMSTSGLAGLITELAGAKLAGVIDNYQSGPEAGLPLARELGLPHAVLSNFPGSSDDATDYYSLLAHNTAQLQSLARQP